MPSPFVFDEALEEKEAAETARLIRGRTDTPPRIAIVLGSGWGDCSHYVKLEEAFKYRDLPHFPPPTIEGHQGTLLLSSLESIPVAVLSGRSHYYEGLPLHKVTFPIRVLARLGVKVCILTNASGGLNLHFKAGETLLVTDHINLMGADPLRGILPAPGRSPFLDQRHIYSPLLADIFRTVAKAESIGLREGVYAAISGPCYETAAEVRMLRSMGADAVGMSTVPEVIVAHREKMLVSTLSCIANVGSDIRTSDLDHESVLKTLKLNTKDRMTLLMKAIPLIAKKIAKLE